jgi:hypothetical protein
MDRPTYPLGDFKSAREWHLYYTYNDPEFIEDMAWFLKDGSKANATMLAKRYAISEEDLNFYHLGYDELGVLNTDLQYMIDFDEKENQVIIRLDPGFTKADFIRLWHEIERDAPELVAAKNKRRRGPENHQLIYAVFKARQRNMTFKAIFEDYANGRLAYYINSNSTQFKNEDDLERFYIQYKPGT